MLKTFVHVGSTWLTVEVVRPPLRSLSDFPVG
jgi:hypothetical protein